MADAAVDRFAFELDALRLELGAGRLDVVHLERDRGGVRSELQAEASDCITASVTVAGLELSRRRKGGRH